MSEKKESSVISARNGNNAVKPSSPTIDWPKEGTEFDEGMVSIRGTCDVNAVVEVFTSYWQRVLPIGTNWSVSTPFGVGPRDIQVRQIVNGLTSDPSTRRIIVKPPSQVPAPVVSEPSDPGFTSLGVPLQFKGTCQSGAKVIIRDVDQTILGEAQVTGSSWTFQYQWHQSEVALVRISQVVNGVVSGSVVRHIGVGLENGKVDMTITDPPENIDELPANTLLRYSGTCTSSNAGLGVSIRLFIGGESYNIIDSGIYGSRWVADLEPLPEGMYRLRFLHGFNASSLANDTNRTFIFTSPK